MFDTDRNGIGYAFGGDNLAQTLLGIALLVLAIAGLGLFFHGLDLMGSMKPTDIGLGALAVFAGATLTRIGLTTGY
jgi:hypothetical protein